MRFAAVSDLHGHLGFALPACDVALVGGDICPDFIYGRARGTLQQKRAQLDWTEKQFLDWRQQQLTTVPLLLATWGNHDYLAPHYAVATETDTLFVVDNLVTLRNGLTIWLSPWSNEFMGWAWMQHPAELQRVYAQIPTGTDIIVSHQPPYGYGDTVPEEYLLSTDDGDRHRGSKELLDAIERVRPQVVVCGHIHGGYGVYQHNETTIYNASVVNEAYHLVHSAHVFDLKEK